jgi:hypothetical protein
MSSGKGLGLAPKPVFTDQALPTGEQTPRAVARSEKRWPCESLTPHE